MTPPRKKPSAKEAAAVTVKQLPWQLRALVDIVMLRSTPVTAVFWCSFLAAMSFHVAYACGWLPTWTGIDQGFVKVTDQAKTDSQREARIAGVEKKIDWELKLTLTRELRDAALALCKARNPSERSGLQTYIDQLVEEYTLVTGKAIVPPSCPNPRGS
jgi:hypothetical protein